MAEHSQRALERRNAQLIAERAAQEKAKKEAQERLKERKGAAYRGRQEFREWAALILSVAGITLSIISLLWQAPLH